MTLQPHLACEKRDIFTGHQKRRAQETYSDFNVMMRNASSQQRICHFWCWEGFWACRANRTCVSSCWHNCHVPAGFPIFCNPISWAVGVNDPYALFRRNSCTGTDVHLAHILQIRVDGWACKHRGVVMPSRSLSSRRQYGWKRTHCHQKFKIAVFLPWETVPSITLHCTALRGERNDWLAYGVLSELAS